MDFCDIIYNEIQEIHLWGEFNVFFGFFVQNYVWYTLSKLSGRDQCYDHDFRHFFNPTF
jgi:hypothetical protein